MPRYFFHVGGSVAVHDEDVFIEVTVCDLTGAACLKVRLVSQVEGP